MKKLSIFCALFFSLTAFAHHDPEQAKTGMISVGAGYAQHGESDLGYIAFSFGGYEPGNTLAGRNFVLFRVTADFMTNLMEHHEHTEDVDHQDSHESRIHELMIHITPVSLDATFIEKNLVLMDSIQVAPIEINRAPDFGITQLTTISTFGYATRIHYAVFSKVHALLQATASALGVGFLSSMNTEAQRNLDAASTHFMYFNINAQTGLAIHFNKDLETNILIGGGTANYDGFTLSEVSAKIKQVFAKKFVVSLSAGKEFYFQKPMGMTQKSNMVKVGASYAF